MKRYAVELVCAAGLAFVAVMALDRWAAKQILGALDSAW